MIGIYGVHNIHTDTWYVGQSNDIQWRWYEHKSDLNANRHHNTHLQRAYNKYGKDVFEWVILEECSLDKLNEREIYWIAKKDSFYDGYNQTLGGGGTRGWVSSKRKAVVCLDSGEMFDCILDAAQYIGVTRTKLKDCINKQKRCHGYWELIPDDYSEEWRLRKLQERKELIAKNRQLAVEKRTSSRPKKEQYVNPNGYHKWSDEAKLSNKGKNGKAVIQLSLSGEYIAEYPSSVIAGETLGLNHRKIRMVCNGERNKCGNFRWKWKDSENA